MPQLVVKIVDKGTNHTNQETGEVKKVSGPDTRHYFLVKKYLSVRCRDLTPFFDQLTQKQRAVLDVIIKNCPEAIQIKATNSSNKTGDTINKKVSAR